MVPHKDTTIPPLDAKIDELERLLGFDEFESCSLLTAWRRLAYELDEKKRSGRNDLRIEDWSTTGASALSRQGNPHPNISWGFWCKLAEKVEESHASDNIGFHYRHEG